MALTYRALALLLTYPTADIQTAAPAIMAAIRSEGLVPPPIVSALDKLARKGVVFLNAYSQAPNTFPSHMSIFTSQYPWTHKVEAIYRDRLAQKTVTLPMALKKYGYRTIWAAAPDTHLSLTSGVERGFDDFVPPAPSRLLNPTWGSAFGWLEKNGSRKFFMFLHTPNRKIPVCLCSSSFCPI